MTPPQYVAYPYFRVECGNITTVEDVFGVDNMNLPPTPRTVLTRVHWVVASRNS